MNVSLVIISDGVNRFVTSFSSTDSVISDAAATGCVVLVIFLFVFENVAVIAIYSAPFYETRRKAKSLRLVSEGLREYVRADESVEREHDKVFRERVDVLMHRGEPPVCIISAHVRLCTNALVTLNKAARVAIHEYGENAALVNGRAFQDFAGVAAGRFEIGRRDVDFVRRVDV